MLMIQPNSKVTVLAHHVEGTTGFQDAFVDYLNFRKIHNIYIRFPFFTSVTKAIWIDNFTDGRLKSRRKSLIRFYKPQLLSFLKDFIWTLIFGPWLAWGSDFVLVTNNLLGLAVWIFRSLGIVKSFGYLVVDYSPRRFRNPLIEKLYVTLDRFILYRADRVWTMSTAMLEGRARDGKIELGRVRFQTAPFGNNSHILTSEDLNRFIKTDLVYVGNPNAKNVRADILIETAAILKKRGIQFRLLIVGPGDPANLKQLSEKLGVADRLVYTGAIPEALDLDRFLAKCGIGLAPYDPGLVDNFSRFADPAKIKTYLGAGLPILTTTVPPNADEVKNAGAGVIVNPFTAQTHADLIEALWSDDSKYLQMREASVRLGKKYSWPSIFDRLMGE
jgi:glycosyltransferase involved in cell wall biosynthesis